MNEYNGLITTKELTEKVGVSRQTIHAWLKAGMPYVPAGIRRNMFKLDDVMKWFEEQRK